MRKVSLLLITILCISVFSSCQSISSDPLALDFTKQIDDVLNLKPKDPTLRIFTDQQTEEQQLANAMFNSVQFQLAYEEYKIYAELLEQTLLSIGSQSV